MPGVTFTAVPASLFLPLICIAMTPKRMVNHYLTVLLIIPSRSPKLFYEIIFFPSVKPKELCPEPSEGFT